MSANLMSLARSGGKFLKLYGDRKMMKTMPTARDYVQDGLVAMWDGIENAGWGVHDPSATTWKDLAGSNDVAILSSAFGEFKNDCYETRPETPNLPPIGHVGKFIDFIHAESVSSIIGGQNTDAFCAFCQATQESTGAQDRIIYHFLRSGSGIGLSKSANGTHIGVSDESVANDVAISISSEYNLSDYTPISAYENGTKVSTANISSPISNAGGYFTLGGRKQGYIGWHLSYRGRLYCVRLYSRSLSEAEITANYAVDKARFGLKTPTI